MRNDCEQVYKKICALKDCEPVPGDFLLKKTGIEIIEQCSYPMNLESVLEVGCGSGINSAFLSKTSRRVIATDLPYYDGSTHTLGMAVAKELLDNISVKNVTLVSCSGEELPFSDNRFDLVFSSSVLEHIDDKEKALKEMMRVTKLGGSVIFIIPTYIQSVCAFAHLYLYMGRRMLEVVHTKILKKPMSKTKTLLPKASDSTRKSSAILGSFRTSHPSFPLPEPHGSYKNIFQEFKQQLPWKWTALAKKCGASSINTFAFLFLPFNIMEVFSTRMIAWIYSRTKSLHCLVARSPLKYFSYSYCVVVKK